MVKLPAQLDRAVVKRRNEFLAGRLCAARALFELGCSQTHVPMGDNREPIWPEDIVGAISHSDGLACALATKSSLYAGLGIDIETWIGNREAQRLIPQVASAKEMDLIASHLGQRRAFTLIFSAKETIYKAVYPSAGRFIDFHEVRCHSLEGNSLSFNFTAPDLLPFTERLSVRFEQTEQGIRTLCLLSHKGAAKR